MTGRWRRNCLYNVQVTGLALHALEPDEEIDVLEHIPGCPSCRALLEESEALLAQLGGAVEQVDPPATLRGAILAEAAETVQTHSPVADEPEQSARELARHRVVDRRRPRGRRDGRLTRRRDRLVAAGLALVSVIAIGGLAVRSVQLEAQRDAETAQARALAEIVTGLTAPDTRLATLTTPDGRVLGAVVVHDGRRTLVTSAALAANAQDRDVYVLWGIAVGADPRPVDTFDVPVPGAEVHPVEPAGEEFVAYAISIEPGRTAPVAPSSVLASGAFQT